MSAIDRLVKFNALLTVISVQPRLQDSVNVIDSVKAIICMNIGVVSRSVYVSLS